MKLFRNIEDFPKIEYPVVTTGGFDGVHEGHKEIIKRLVEAAKENNGESVIMTFSPHPRLVLYPDDDIQILTTDEEKIEQLNNYKIRTTNNEQLTTNYAGIDNLIMYPFTKEFSKLTSEEFIKNILVDKLHTKKLIIGYDHQFGKDRKGDFHKLTEFSKLYNFDLDKIPEHIVENIAVSSTRIRDYLSRGKIKHANALLGYKYNITGKVIEGNKIGIQLGYPTANIEVNDTHKLVPPPGVYAVKIKHNDLMYGGMLYIGNRPTISSAKFAIEVNIFDFNKDIYKENITIYFLAKIRDDKKFDNLDALKKQITNDKETILNLLKTSNE